MQAAFLLGKEGESPWQETESAVGSATVGGGGLIYFVGVESEPDNPWPGVSSHYGRKFGDVKFHTVKAGLDLLPYPLRFLQGIAVKDRDMNRTLPYLLLHHLDHLLHSLRPGSDDA